MDEIITRRSFAALSGFVVMVKWLGQHSVKMQLAGEGGVQLIVGPGNNLLKFAREGRPNIRIDFSLQTALRRFPEQNFKRLKLLKEMRLPV